MNWPVRKYASHEECTDDGSLDQAANMASMYTALSPRNTSDASRRRCNGQAARRCDHRAARPMTATIAAEMGEAPQGDGHYRALFLIGIVLMLITLVVNFTADLVVKGIRGRENA